MCKRSQLKDVGRVDGSRYNVYRRSISYSIFLAQRAESKSGQKTLLRVILLDKSGRHSVLYISLLTANPEGENSGLDIWCRCIKDRFDAMTIPDPRRNAFQQHLQLFLLGDCLLLSHGRPRLTHPHNNVHFVHVLLRHLTGCSDLR